MNKSWDFHYHIFKFTQCIHHYSSPSYSPPASPANPIYPTSPFAPPITPSPFAPPIATTHQYLRKWAILLWRETRLPSTPLRQSWRRRLFRRRSSRQLRQRLDYAGGWIVVGRISESTRRTRRWSHRRLRRQSTRQSHSGREVEAINSTRNRFRRLAGSTRPSNVELNTRHRRVEGFFRRCRRHQTERRVGW